MLKLAWDFFLSFTIRAVFVVALVGGVDWLVISFFNWRPGEWKDEPRIGELSLALAAVTALVGLIGTFRRGRAEANFSITAVAGIFMGVTPPELRHGRDDE